MSERERWIVYPLLFFSFALAIRDQWPKTGVEEINFDVLNCRHLVVKDAQGNIAVDISAKHGGTSAGSGAIVVYGPAADGGSSKPAAVRIHVAEKLRDVQEDHSGVVETFSPLGSRATLLACDKYGGIAITYDAASKPKAAILPLRITRPPPDDPRQAVPKPPQP